MPMKMLMKEQVRFQYDYSLWTLLIGNNPDGQLWFLYVLFVLSIVSILFVNERNLKWWCAAAVCASVVAPIIPSTVGLPGITLSFSMYQIGFYFMGLMLIVRRDAFFENSKVALICVAVWVGYSSMQIFNVNIWWLKALAAWSAIYCILYLCKILTKTRVSKWLSYLGRHSMDIYIIHAPILVIGRTVFRQYLGASPWIYIIVLSTIAVVLSLLISQYIVRRVKLFRYLLLGLG
jgi:peptidoglycan/LPS O-acetylase OafA/YrhL